MHIPIPAGHRRRTRRALIAAALPAALAALVLPAAADAGTAAVIRASANGVLGYTAADGEVNNVRVSVSGNKLVISDSAPITARNGCTLNLVGDAECPIGVDSITMLLRDRNDVVQYAAPHFGGVSGEDGNDTFFGGIRQSVPGRSIQNVHYFGNAGHDTISYQFADRGVSLTPEDNLANDGRPGIDRENVAPGFDVIFGSQFNDSPLFGTDLPEIMNGLGGNDFIAGGHGNDLFQSSFQDGADDYHGGPGRDTIDYAGRTQPVRISLDNVVNDGESGERDNVRTNVENLYGGSAGDFFESHGAFSRLDGRGGDDVLLGGAGPDTVIGGPGNDILNSGQGIDHVDSRDGQLDTIDCSQDTDSLVRDRTERSVVDCETVAIGKLRLATKSARMTAGKTARLKLSWRHPRAWKQLRTIELRLTRDDVPVGAVTIRPRGKKITGSGAVELVRKRSRIAAKGKTVTARLAVRLDGSVAGATLKAEVEATDKRGRRQLERNAATIRVAK